MTKCKDFIGLGEKNGVLMSYIDRVIDQLNPHYDEVTSEAETLLLHYKSSLSAKL